MCKEKESILNSEGLAERQLAEFIKKTFFSKYNTKNKEEQWQ